LPVLSCASFAVAWRRFVPAATGTIASNEPSVCSAAVTPLTTTEVTPWSSVATPFTVM
jgi:hypothetical protein